VSALLPDLALEAGHSSSRDDLAIQVANLTRRFGASRALAGLSLDVPWGQRLAILGPNGAGKTSLLRILATLGQPTSGQVVVGGLRLPDQAAAIRRYVGFVSHQTLLYDELSVRENLRFYGTLYRVSNLARRIDEVLERVGVGHRADDRVRALSRGLQQRAALARAILHDPPILLLDEPETGLDVAGADLLADVLLDADGRLRTVLLTSHDVERALRLADRVVVIVRGKLAYDRPVAAAPAAEVEAVIRGERPQR
jgi:heme exporter protein A